MWVGTQTSQVEIKLSLKACQVGLFVHLPLNLCVLVFSAQIRIPFRGTRKNRYSLIQHY